MSRALRPVAWLFALLALVAVLLVGGRMFLGTDAGRALILRALPLYAPQSGLRVTAGRIDGDVFGRVVIRDLALADPAGVFARVPRLDLDWRPLTLARNRLTIRAADAAVMTVLRRPHLRPSADTRVLPDIDVTVDRLHIGRLDLAAPVTGRAEVLALDATGLVEAGRARVTATATSATGGDVVRLRLDTEPDRDRFDLAATVAAPAGGTVARLLALPAALDATVAGKGSWREWHGTAQARLGRYRLADLVLTQTLGRVIVTGSVAPAPLLDGIAARAANPAVAVRFDARLTGRRLTGRLDAASPVVRVAVTGGADFGQETFAGLRVEARLLRPSALLPRLSGRDIVLSARVAGTFATPVADYVLTTPSFAWGSTQFAGFRATGHVVGAIPLTIPVDATAVHVAGIGEAGPLLDRLRVAGPLVAGAHAITGAALAVRSAGVVGTLGVRLDYAGGYRATFDGRLPRYVVPDLGVADIAATVVALPAAGGTRVTGTVRAVATRLDSTLFRTVFAGLPVATSAIDVAPDLSIRFTDLRVAAPGLTVAGTGSRDAAGIVRIVTRGTSRDYGPVGLTLAGPIAAPVVDVTLAAPGYGLTAVTARVAPGADGWHVDARGASRFGGASLAARLYPGGTGADVVAAVGGIAVRGPLTLDAAGHASGRLTVAGSGLSGALVLAGGTAQRADLSLAAAAARVGATTIGRGTVTAHAVVGAGAPVVEARVALADVRSGTTLLTSASGSVALANNAGSATVAVAGIAAVPFTASLDARGTAEHIDLGATALVDGRRLGLDHRASIDRVGGTWRLAPAAVVTPDGRVEVAGSYGNGLTATVRADNLGLGLLGVIDPAFDVSGRVSGNLAAVVPASGPTTGTLSLRVANLSRAGLGAASLPIDLAVNAALTGDAASARAVIVRAGSTVGRAQAALRLPAGGSLTDRVLAAPLAAQLRFDGPAQALWALTGVESLDVRGPVILALDAGGRVGEPQLSGSVGARGARIENTAFGTVIDNVTLDGRFAGARLDLAKFAGTVGKDGTVDGAGTIDLSAERGFPLDVSVRLDNAQVVARDDLHATATGTIKVHSTGGAGTIAGKLAIVRARYRLGRPAGVADVPVLEVGERNAQLLGRAAVRAAKPTQWTLDVGLDAPDNVVVAGLGLNSIWRGALRVTGRATAPSIKGRVALVRGDYDFSGKRFSLSRGDVRFDGDAPPDPVIDIVAENTSSGFTAQLNLTGTARYPEIRFSSVPALPEDEVLSRVLFGSSITTLSAPEAIQLAGALATLRSGGKGFSAALDPLGAVRRGLKIDRLRVLPADTTTGRKTSIAAGQYIGRRLYVELSTDAQGYSATSIEIALTRTFSILSTVATLGGTSANLRLKRDY